MVIINFIVTNAGGYIMKEIINIKDEVRYVHESYLSDKEKLDKDMVNVEAFYPKEEADNFKKEHIAVVPLNKITEEKEKLIIELKTLKDRLIKNNKKVSEFNKTLFSYQINQTINKIDSFFGGLE